jgi:hypothetical protein
MTKMTVRTDLRLSPSELRDDIAHEIVTNFGLQPQIAENIATSVMVRLNLILMRASLNERFFIVAAEQDDLLRQTLHRYMRIREAISNLAEEQKIIESEIPPQAWVIMRGEQ